MATRSTRVIDVVAFGPKSIRGKVTLVAVLGTLAAMAAVVAVTFFSMQFVLRQSLTAKLNAYIDKAQAAVEHGAFAEAVAYAGTDLLQVIDADGNVVASSAAADGLGPIPHMMWEGEKPFEVDDIDLFEERPAPDDGGGTPAGQDVTSPGQQASSGAPDPDVDFDDDAAGGWQEADSDSGTSGSDYDDSYGDADNVDADDGVSEADGDVDDGDVERSFLRTSEVRKGPIASQESEGASSAEYLSGDDESLLEDDATSVLGDDGPYVIIKRDVQTERGDYVIVAMTTLGPTVRAARTAAAILAAVFAVLLALVALFAWRLSSKTLEPVEEMRLGVERIGADDLSARVPVPDGDKDLERLANTFNDLLGRVEGSMSRQRRFMSDASHELKSPIAATGIMLETLRDHPEVLDTEETLADLAEENDRMAQMVANMLALARHDEGAVTVEKAPVDLFDLLFEEANALRARSAVDVDMTGVEPVVCRADGELIGHAVRNLLDNAARYARSKVALGCVEDGGVVRIVVADDGPGIAPENRERAFDRFVRLEDSRSRKKGSTGLGLAVVNEIVRQHGGSVRFEDGTLGGACAVIEIPAG